MDGVESEEDCVSIFKVLNTIVELSFFYSMVFSFDIDISTSVFFATRTEFRREGR